MVVPAYIVRDRKINSGFNVFSFFQILRSKIQNVPIIIFF